MDTQSVAATRARSSPEWLPNVLKQLEAMRRVPENWDGYHADAPRPEMIDAAIEYIQSLVRHAPVIQPYVSPTRVGGVLFAWECGPHQLEAELDPGEPHSFIYLNRETDEASEGSLQLNPAADKEFMSRLRFFAG